MNSIIFSPVLADWFDRLRLQLPDPIVNWLTPVWILCVGVTAGLILTALLWGLLWLISRIPGMASLADKRTSRWTAIAVLTILIFAGLAALYFPAANTKAGDAAQAAAAAVEPVAGPAPAAPQPLDRAWAIGGCLIAAWLLAIAVVTLARPKALAETNIALREGVLWPLFITALVMAGCCLFGLFIVRKPLDLLDSLKRWPVLAMKPVEVFEPQLEAPPNAFDEPAEQILDIQFRKDEIQSLAVKSDQ